MDPILALFNGLDRIFLLCAVLGGFMLLIRIVMSVLFGGDADADADDGAFHDADSSFRMLTIHGMTSFFLTFGLIGLAMHRGSGFGELASVLVAFVGGAVTMAGIAKLTHMMQGLQSSGNVDIGQAVGQSGTVYLTIPADGAGQVQVSVANRLRVVDAIAEDRTAAIKTGTRVEVVQVNGDGTLVVRQA